MGLLQLVIALAILAIAASACGSETEAKPEADVKLLTEDTYEEFYVAEIEGRTCIVFDSYKAGGISCDWSPK